MSPNFAENLYQGTGYATGQINLGHGTSYAPFNPASVVPNHNQERSLLTFSGASDPACFPSQPNTTPSYRSLPSNTTSSYHQSQLGTAPSYNSLQQSSTAPSYNPLQSSTAPPYNTLQPSTIPLPLQPNAMVQNPNRMSYHVGPLPDAPSTLAAGGSPPGSVLNPTPSPFDLSSVPSLPDTVVPNRVDVGVQADLQLIPKSAVFGGPIQGASPSALPSSHFPPPTLTATPYHNVAADRAGNPLIPTHSVKVPSLTFGAGLDSAGSSAQLYHPSQLHTKQISYGVSSQTGPLLNTSSAPVVGNPSGTTQAASVSKHAHHIPTQHLGITPAPPLPGSYLKATTGNHHRSGRSDQKIGIKLPSCPEGKPCVYGSSSSLCGSCHNAMMASILSEYPSQAIQSTPSSTEAEEPLKAASGEHHLLGYGVNVHGGPQYPHPTLVHANSRPLQHQPLPEQPLAQPPWQLPERAQPEWLRICLHQHQRIQQLETQVSELKQQFQQLQSLIVYQQQPPSQHEQKPGLSLAPPTSQRHNRHKSHGHVSPTNHDHDTRQELQRYIEEILKSEDGQALLNQAIRKRRQNMSRPLTTESLSRTPCGQASSNTHLKESAFPDTREAARTTNNRNEGRQESHTDQVGPEDNAKTKDRKKLDDEKTRRIRECRERNPNMSYEEIGRMHGVAKSTAHRTINPR